MSRCSFCNKRTHLPSVCKFCEECLCISCYNPERHKCRNIDKFLSNVKSNHKNELLTNKCTSNKIDKI